ncbi:M23 family metallopeptidase [Microbacterium karelineae]|uniref:M23 family metallopeptidase n=1 Tax=Microbacterium karelineae TaxID=2654283 RepID=UPI0012EA3CB3|nr:M23 family metallopeptidase [Microbacterium karelineae]
MTDNESARNELTRTDAQTPAERPLSNRKMVAAARKDLRRADRAAKRTGSAVASRRLTPVRAVGTLAAVCALIAGVAIPAYAATQQQTAAEASVRDEAAVDAQSFEVSADVATADLATTSYAARTAEEIEQIEAEREALERAREAQRQAEEEAAANQDDAGAGEPAGVPQSPAAPALPDAPAPTVVDGAVNPLPAGSYYVSRSVSAGHAGTDMVTHDQSDGAVPIYAVKSGTVTVSSEAHYGWGVTVAIDHGDGTQTLYGHMTYGTRQVEVGQTVEAGQVIGYVGSTGRSTAHHLHIELRINGAIVDPMAYLPI